MKMNKIKIALLSLLATVFICSCDKDDSPFSGSDNYISSFSLTQGGVTFNAEISLNSITISAPENLSLTGATANVVLSENAGISPNPATITDWDKEQTFVVTAFNGTQNIYQYKVDRHAISKDGDIVLLNQADVEALAALQLTQINGSLTIGAAAGADSVYSLAPLAGLKTIKYGLIINATYAGESLAGLENLVKVGAFQIAQNKKLKTVSLLKLKAVMSDLIVSQSLVRTLEFHELTNIDKGLQIITLDSLVQMNFPKLKNIVENLTLQGSWSVNKLQFIDFPALEKIGGNINISNWKEVTKVNLPLLGSTTAISVTSRPSLEKLSAPKLKTILGSTNISSNKLLTDLDLSTLQNIGGDFRLENCNELKDLNGLKALVNVGGEMFINSLSELKNIQGLKALKSVGKRCYLSNWPLLEDETLSGLANLNNVGGELTISQIPFKKFSGFALNKVTSLGIYGNGISSIEEIDVRNIEIENTLTIQNITTNYVLKGAVICNYSLNISASNLNMEGFKEVKNFTYNMSVKQLDHQSAGIKKVTGDLSFNGYGFDKFSMPALEEVSGKFNLTASNGMQSVELPLLKKTGIATLDVAALPSFSLPALQLVDGNCSITTGRYQSDNLSNLQMPVLTTVNGTLSLSGYSSYYFNSKLTNLNGLAALKNVKGIALSWNTGLVDLTGLKNALSSFSASNWKVSDNGYNPTYQDMLEGKYVKP